MDQAIRDAAVNTFNSHKESVGYMLDTALAGGAVAAYVLQIEQLLGAIGAAAIFLLALGTALYRFLYWRARSKRADIELHRAEDE